MLREEIQPAQLGARMKRLRLKRGLSQDDVAGSAYTAAYVSLVENGKKSPSEAALKHFSIQLGVTLEQLISGRDPDDDLEREIQTQRAVAAIHEGRAQEALDALSSVLEDARSVGHSRVMVLAETAMGGALFRLGQVDEALAAYERVTQGTGTAELRTTAMAGKARCLLAKGEAREAVFILEGHLQELERSDPPDPGCLVEIYAALIPVYFESGMISRAMDVASRGWQLAPNVQGAEQRACLFVNRAQLLATRGEGREALSSLALAEDLYRHLGWYTEVVKVSLARSYVLAEEKRYAEAEALLRRSLGSAGERVDRLSRVLSLTRLSFIRRVSGDPEEAVLLAEQAIALAGDSFRGAVAEAQREAGLCAIDLGDTERGVALLREALEAFRSAADHEEIARTAKILGRHLAETGDAEGALAVFEDGLSSVSDLK